MVVPRGSWPVTPGPAEPRRVVYYAPSRLLRSFTLRYAPFSRTVKGEGA